MKTENIKKLIDKQFKTKYFSSEISYFQREKFLNLDQNMLYLFMAHCGNYCEEENINKDIKQACLNINNGDLYFADEHGNLFSPYSSHEEEEDCLIQQHVSFIMTYLKYIKSNESITFMLHGCDNQNYEVHLMTVSAKSIFFRELK